MQFPHIHSRPLALAVAALLSPALAQAQSGQPQLEEIVVFGRNLDLVGRADAASQGTVSGADLLVRPMFKTAELLESMPGMVAVQHSGSGKANQYFLRGFNLDHGTDYSVHLDGMPMNLRSHGHGQGYLDVNGLIPETVRQIDYRKGPYWADLGDFSMAGASFIQTIDELEQSFVSSEIGQYGWRRLAGGGSHELGDGTVLLVGEYKQYDGPWDNEEDLNHASLWGKYLVDTRFGDLSFTLSGYEASWDPTEQIPERAIGSAVCPDAFCSLDPTAEGETSRWMLGSNLNGTDWNLNLYGQYYDWQMQSNPTYDFQLNQFDRRWTVGGNGDYTLLEGGAFDLTAGGDFRYDDIGKVGLDHYANGDYVSNISENSIDETSMGGFLQGTWHLSDSLRLSGGVRADHYRFDVRAHGPGSFAGDDSESRVSPKAGIAWAATDDLEFYGNWGRGFHSNDARGVVNDLDPVPGLSPGTGYEAGARASVGDFKFTAAYWWLDQDSELIFVGDSNAVEPKGGSERDGVELTMFWQPLDWLGVDAVYTSSDARYTNNPDGDWVEGAVEEAGQIGVSATRDNWDLSVRLRYLGPYALVPDNSKRAESLTTVNVRGAWHWNAVTVYAELINLLDSDKKEIVYDYPAYVQGLDPAGLTSEDIDCATVNCRMSRVTVPRTFRLGLSYKF